MIAGWQVGLLVLGRVLGRRDRGTDQKTEEEADRLLDGWLADELVFGRGGETHRAMKKTEEDAEVVFGRERQRDRWMQSLVWRRADEDGGGCRA